MIHCQFGYHDGVSIVMKQIERVMVNHLGVPMIHCQFGYHDGVSIVMKQIERVMVNHLGVPEKNIFYLVGRSKQHGLNITIKPSLWIKNKTNQLMIKHFGEGYGGNRSERIEKAISKAKLNIKGKACY